MPDVKRNLLIAFAMGGCLLGATDLFHTATGVQIYHITRFTVGDFHWPFYIPLQMGLIAAGIMGLWMIIYRRIVAPAMGTEPESAMTPIDKTRETPGMSVSATARPTAIIPAVAAVMIAAGFVMGWALAGAAHHASWYLLAFALALLAVAVLLPRPYVVAFVMTALCGTAIEWLALSPAAGYYSFIDQDFFGRAPAWLPFSYGWGGVFCHYFGGTVRDPVQ